MNQTRDITQWFTSGALSKYGTADVVFKAKPGSVKAEALPDGAVRIKGWASTDDVDLANDVIKAEAYQSSISDYGKRGTMLFMHDWYSIPIGKFDVLEIKDRGLWVEGTVLPTNAGKDVAMLIDANVLDALSVGFSIKKSTTDEDSGVRTINDLQLHEISVVNAGMNPQALFTQAKSLGLAVPSITAQQGTNAKDHNMSEPTLDKEHLALLNECKTLIGEHGTALETVSGDMTDLQTNIRDQKAMLDALSAKHTQVAEGIITKDELNGFVQKIGKDILDVQESIKKAKLGNETKIDPLASMALSNWKLLTEAKGIVAVTDDNGRPLSEMQQKAYRYFQMPVKYDQSEQSVWLKTLREVADTCAIVGAFFRGQHPHVDLSTLKSFQLLHSMMEKTDPEFAKAMYSTGSGAGDEWVPTLMSANLYDLYRLAPSIENHIAHFQMPSNPFTWPIKTSGATLYRAAEATVNNPNQLTKSNIGTSNITFTAETFAVAVAVSPQLIEDALIAMVPEIQAELAFTARDGYEGMLMNGDDSTTHRDTNQSYTSVNPETYEDGLRFLAIDLSSNVNFASATSGTGDGSSSFGAGDVRSLRKEMGKRGKQPNDCVYVTSMDGWFHILGMDEFTKPGTYNAGETWRTGTLTLIDGAELTVSEKMSNTLDSSGLDTAASEFTGLVCFNKTAFKIGEKRGMTVEFEKNILTQQWAFVGTMRKSFKNMDASSLTPVAYGYKITS